MATKAETLKEWRKRKGATIEVNRAKWHARRLGIGVAEYTEKKAAGYRVCPGRKKMGPWHWVKDGLSNGSACDDCLVTKRRGPYGVKAAVLHVVPLPPVVNACALCAAREAVVSCLFCDAPKVCRGCLMKHACNDRLGREAQRVPARKRGWEAMRSKG